MSNPSPIVALTPVVSSQIESVGYNAEARILAVRFKPGKISPASTYHYLDVPEATATEFLGSASVGSALIKMIKGRFNFVKLAADVATTQEA